MAQPLARWNDDNLSHPQLVWWSRLDNKYQVEVHRTGDRTGVLYVFDHNDNNKELFSKDVDLSYGAQFGPDVADVAEWQKATGEFVDSIH